jgi:hypothetical protein
MDFLFNVSYFKMFITSSSSGGGGKKSAVSLGEAIAIAGTASSGGFLSVSSSTVKP